MKDTTFRIVILLVIVVAALAWVGWIRLGHDSGQTTIEVETGKMQNALEESVDQGRDFVESAIDSTRGDDDSPSRELPREAAPRPVDEPVRR